MADMHDCVNNSPPDKLASGSLLGNVSFSYCNQNILYTAVVEPCMFLNLTP